MNELQYRQLILQTATHMASHVLKLYATHAQAQRHTARSDNHVLLAGNQAVHKQRDWRVAAQLHCVQANDMLVHTSSLSTPTRKNREA